MLKSEIRVGEVYRAKISDKLTDVRVDSIRDTTSGVGGRSVTHYTGTNLATGRQVYIRSASKFRCRTKEQSNVALRADDSEASQSADGNGDIENRRSHAGTTNRAIEPPTVATSPAVQPTSLREKLAGKIIGSTDNAPHVIVEALAGTGKTTTLVEGLKRVKNLPTTIEPSPQQAAVWAAMELSRDVAKSIGFVAFNRSIADELKRRVPQGCDAMTMHGMGLKSVTRAFGRVNIVENSNQRVEMIIEEITGKDIKYLRKFYPVLVSATIELVGLCKMNLIGLEGNQTMDAVDSSDWAQSLSQLASHYDVDTNSSQEEIFKLVPKVMARCLDVQRDNLIDYNDMIWLPIALGLPIWKYDLLLVDECLPSWTPVMMWDGSSKDIKDVRVGDRVRSFDVLKSRAKNCVVSAVQKLPNRKPLVKIKVRHNHRTGTNRKSNFVVCTTDHKVWTSNRGWVEAGQVQIGDTVVVETAAKTTQKGKVTKSGRDQLSSIHYGNKKGTGANGGQSAEDFNRIKGGNGRGLTAPQKILLEALGPSWVAEYVVKTGDAPQFGKGDKPSHYKIDLANPSRKVAIEIDGESHRKEKESDSKKDNFLKSLGWSVFRFTNREIAKDFPGVIQEVCPDQVHCPRTATVESVEETYITEHFVYDITVENCHNFYANGVLVHNCQDLNRCQQQLAMRAGNRLILCGDPNQAIYGFAGADSESMDRMRETLSATERGVAVLPLTVTRRCGKAIVAKAKSIVPAFEAHENNGEGKISSAPYVEEDGQPSYRSQVQDGDFIICRVNAPLVSQCFTFIREGRKANIIGRDIGAGLTRLVNKLLGKTELLSKPEGMEFLTSELDRWYTAEQRKENAKRNPSDSKLIALQDKYECLMTFCEDAITPQSVLDRIDSVFSDRTTYGIRLSSIHKSKGLESKRVFVLTPPGASLPHPMAKSSWQRQQERNLEYVAYTRAIEELYCVS